MTEDEKAVFEKGKALYVKTQQVDPLCRAAQEAGWETLRVYVAMKALVKDFLDFRIELSPDRDVPHPSEGLK